MRQPTDLCLLCKIRPATKTNSHILSRFISTAFLEGAGARKGFSLDSDTILKQEGDQVVLGRTKTIQDSPKENYILCPECETYLGVVESLSRDTFITWRDKVALNEFSLITVIPGELKVLECTSSNPRIIRLFAYSLFWRASISSLDLFAEYSLPCDIEEELRSTLHKYEGDRLGFLAKIAADPNFSDYPYGVVTSEVFNNGDANFLMAIPHNALGFSTLLIDRFAFMLYQSLQVNDAAMQGPFNNRTLGDCKMMVVPETVWKMLFNEAPARVLLDISKNNIK
ncbi:hypothetical protein CJD36_016860 [Flavipsychrobacter stenotrophus]|uniref:Uncharacterized protein n=1 Tax=Flavipsychrobacter stenotrophus TaxID=2077091 RepID=A0A2S7SRS8_9BACT|nr:hypothetical protein [Flavipsychrobacter stenotrophus]PQJ09610.1 hypothetical protein CJD36_016860 [Flavipsychrobacter stenotrophus]